MPRGNSPYHHSSLNGLTMRAGRAAEDPTEMTRDATLTKLAGYVVAILRENPDLDDRQAANAARLRMRAEMGQLARKSAEVRRARQATAGNGAA